MLGIVLAVVYAFLFVLLIKKMRFFSIQGISKNWLVLVFIVKLFAGTALWCVYTYYYPERKSGDIYKYFDDGLVMYHALFAHPTDYLKMLFGLASEESLHIYYSKMMNWSRLYDLGLFNENKTIIRFNALCDIFSFGNYHVHTVFICFLSLVGLTGIYKSLVVYLSDKKKLLFAVVFLIPSVLFWGSGVLKEGLCFFSLGMLMFCYFKLINEKFSWWRVILLLLFTFLLFITKLHVLAAITPPLLAHLLIVKTGNKMIELKYIVVVFFLFIASLIFPNYHLPTIIADKKEQALSLSMGGSYLGNEKVNKYVWIDAQYQNRVVYLKNSTEYGKIRPGLPYRYWTVEESRKKKIVAHATDTLTYYVFIDQPPAGSYIKTADLDGTTFNLLKNSPMAFINAAFRPHIFEAENALMLFAALENTGIILFILFCIIFSVRRLEHKSIFYFCLLNSLLLFTLIGLTTPVLGSVVRYKIPLLPFFLTAFLFLLDIGKVQKLIRKG